MVEAIRIYVEGGGDRSQGKGEVRIGFNKFLRGIREHARQKRIKWDVIPCGPISKTYDNFCRALLDYPDAFNILLVDSDTTVQQSRWATICDQHNLNNPKVGEEHCQLMVQIFETWLIADIDLLKKFYGADFNPNPIPMNPDIETITKSNVYAALKQATEKTQKGKYHKIKHGPKILAELDAAKVRAAAPHCDRLFSTLEQKIGE